MDSYPNDREIFLIIKSQRYCIVAIIVRSIIIIQTKSWRISWILIEINIIIIILQLIEENIKEKIILFLVFQSLPAICILTYIVYSQTSIEKIIVRWAGTIVIIAIICKIGIFPFHNWILSIRKSISWTNNFVVMTVQKIIPIVFIIKIRLKTTLMYIRIISIIVISRYLLIVSTIKLFLIASSLVHLTWIIIGNFQSIIGPLIYLIFYSIILSTIIRQAKKREKKIIKDQIGKTSLYKINIFRLAGIPPTTGFMLKAFIIISITLKIIPNFILILIVIVAAISFYAYRQMLYKPLHNTTNHNWNKKIYENKNTSEKKRAVFNISGIPVIYTR